MSRRNEPWYWEARRAWYVKINGKRIKLGADKEEAFRRFHAIKAEVPRVVKDEHLLEVTIDRFLTWTTQKQRAGSFGFTLKVPNILLTF